MKTEIQRQMTQWDGKAGDRIDPVAQALRRLHLRVELCPCKYGGRDDHHCKQCENDLESIEEAWLETNPKQGKIKESRK